MKPSKYAIAMNQCAEYRDEWCRKPENQRPPFSDRVASHAWWKRWMSSPEKAHCDQILRAAGFEQLATLIP